MEGMRTFMGLMMEGVGMERGSILEIDMYSWGRCVGWMRGVFVRVGGI